MHINPQKYEKLGTGSKVVIKWIGHGVQTQDEGELEYAFCRKHPILDDSGKIIAWVIVPARCGIKCGEITKHFTNAFEIHID